MTNLTSLPDWATKEAERKTPKFINSAGVFESIIKNAVFTQKESSNGNPYVLIQLDIETSEGINCKSWTRIPFDLYDENGVGNQLKNALGVDSFKELSKPSDFIGKKLQIITGILTDYKTGKPQNSEAKNGKNYPSYGVLGYISSDSSISDEQLENIQKRDQKMRQMHDSLYNPNSINNDTISIEDLPF